MSFESELNAYESQQDSFAAKGDRIATATQKLLRDPEWTGDILTDIEKNYPDELHDVIVEIFSATPTNPAHGMLHALFHKAARELAINQDKPQLRVAA